MNRLTRTLTLVNSSESHPLVSHLRRNPTARSLAGVSSVPTQIKLSHRRFSSRNNSQRISISVVSVCRRPAQLLTAMDADAPRSLEYEDRATADDFVSIDPPASPVRQDASPDIENFVQSISSSMDEGRGDDSGEDGSTDAGPRGDQRKVLPEELSRSVMMLSCESSAEGGICDVYLVGTAHVSQESCQEVEAVISFLKPQAVFLELCSSRLGVLTPQNLKVPTMGEMIDMWKKQHNTFGILYSWFLAKVASKLEVFPGSEFRVAFEEAMKYGGKVILGDRAVQITLRRTWAKMPLWHKTKLLYSLIFQAFFLPSPEDLNKMLKEMDDVDMLTLVIQEMSKEFPTLMETLVHERDQYMSSTLLRVASEHNSVVAVVGKGHLQGIKKHWMQPVEVKDLMLVDIPSQKPAISVMKILSTLGVAAAGVAIVSGVYLSTKK